jgi:hypothetical protein
MQNFTYFPIKDQFLNTDIKVIASRGIKIQQKEETLISLLKYFPHRARYLRNRLGKPGFRQACYAAIVTSPVQEAIVLFSVVTGFACL